MKKDDHHLVGSLLKTTGNKGEIILKFNDDISEEIQRLESILVEVDGKLVPFFIESLKIKSSSTIIVKIEGLDNDENSTEFIGSNFYISKLQYQDLGFEASEFVDVKGYQVKDQNEIIIGSVLEFIDISENPLLNVKTEKGEVLVPASEDLIIEIDDEANIISLEIPDGLLDLD